MHRVAWKRCFVALLATGLAAGSATTGARADSPEPENPDPENPGAGASTGDTAPPLEWDWTSAPVRYRAEIDHANPWGVWFIARENAEARAMRYSLVVESTCAVDRARRRAWSLHCKLDEVQISGKAAPGEQDRLDTIFAEYEELLPGATLAFVFRHRGRIRSVDLEAFTPTTTRSSVLHEDLRTLMARFAGLLELELPRDGRPTEDPWKQGGAPVLLTLGDLEGTAGGVRMFHEVVPQPGDRVRIRSTAEGSAVPGQSLDGASTIIVDLALSGWSIFDSDPGLLRYREYLLAGDLTSSSTEVARDTWVRESGTLVRLDAEGQPLPIPEEGAEPGR